MATNVRSQAKLEILKKKTKEFHVPHDVNGKALKVSEYFGANVFNFERSEILTKSEKKQMDSVINKREALTEDLADKYASSVLNWATSKGVTHFTHWFQPLTDLTAEKHDAFLSFDGVEPIEKLSATQLTQGEPDASSFPNGGSRSTFEARGYTSWDLSSPIFIRENENGSTLCIPTGFVSYHGDALDIKTPLLRSIDAVSNAAAQFVNLTSGSKRDFDKVHYVDVTAGCEQEYFLIDKSFYYERPDLVMSGRTLFGASTSRNQQLDDHYFGTVPDRVMAFMQEVEVELYKMGVPAKTRHNEVAPGQYELAPIFGKANIAADQNQIIMATLQSVALKHDLVCLLHEKPFGGINGSGKHVNWAMSTPSGDNLLEPTDTPHTNYRFLSMIAVICEAVNRHAASLRSAIASHGNDHRLGANEAPPSIISIFLGDTLTAILEAYANGESYEEDSETFVKVNTSQLARLVKDNTDRNRTSPFAFTGNKFEFRAVGSAANVGIPMTVLNGAVASVLNEVNERIKTDLDSGKALNDVLMSLIKDLYNNSKKVVFNGDGYGDEWVKEAERRGLPNLRTSASALKVIMDTKANTFLTDLRIYSPSELETRYNVRVERYCMHRTIEFSTLLNILSKDIVPCIIKAKGTMAKSIADQKSIGLSTASDEAIIKDFSEHFETLVSDVNKLTKYIDKHANDHSIEYAELIAKDILPLSQKIAESIAFFENNISDDLWPLPTYFDMLFIK